MKKRVEFRSYDELIRDHLRDPEFARAWACEEPKAVLAANVLRLRELEGLTQKELAHRAEMRQPRIAEIERGDANPRLETVARIAYALRTSVDVLYRDPRADQDYTYRLGATSEPLTIEALSRIAFRKADAKELEESSTYNDNFALAG